MAEYIDKVAATTIPTPPKENRVYLTDNLDDVFDAGWHEAQRCISNLPAADVRERVPVENVMEYRHVKYDPDEFFGRKRQKHTGFIPPLNRCASSVFVEDTNVPSKRQTNADRIRKMSDEELASIITDDWCELLNCESPCDGHCDLKVLDWLKEATE
jgi:hypothetical protein